MASPVIPGVFTGAAALGTGAMVPNDDDESSAGARRRTPGRTPEPPARKDDAGP